jgi:hypothetical protein
VVVTLGTTAIGAVDALDQVLKLKERYRFRVHVDGAYGGYFRLIADDLAEETRRAYLATMEADSLVIDPHKHGLQPYGCGCVLFRDPAVGAVLQARLAIYVLHIKGVASRRNQPGVLAGRGSGCGVVGDAAAFATCAGRRVCAGAQARAGSGFGTGSAAAGGWEI